MALAGTESSSPCGCMVRHQTSKLAYSDGEATRVDRQLSFIAFCTAHALIDRAHGSPASKGR